jgi:hypothetical protein
MTLTLSPTTSCLLHQQGPLPVEWITQVPTMTPPVAPRDPNMEMINDAMGSCVTRTVCPHPPATHPLAMAGSCAPAPPPARALSRTDPRTHSLMNSNTCTHIWQSRTLVCVGGGEGSSNYKPCHSSHHPEGNLVHWWVGNGNAVWDVHGGARHPRHTPRDGAGCARCRSRTSTCHPTWRLTLASPNPVPRYSARFFTMDSPVHRDQLSFTRGVLLAPLPISDIDTCDPIACLFMVRLLSLTVATLHYILTHCRHDDEVDDETDWCQGMVDWQELCRHWCAVWSSLVWQTCCTRGVECCSDSRLLLGLRPTHV